MFAPTRQISGDKVIPSYVHEPHSGFEHLQSHPHNNNNPDGHEPKTTTSSWPRKVRNRPQQPRFNVEVLRPCAPCHLINPTMTQAETRTHSTLHRHRTFFFPGIICTIADLMTMSPVVPSYWTKAMLASPCRFLLCFCSSCSCSYGSCCSCCSCCRHR